MKFIWRWLSRYMPPPFEDLEPYVLAAIPGVQKFEGRGPSGEWRRHRVYAELLKAFPKAAKVDLAMAIELAVRRERGRHL